jgi:hypothetical protein
MTEEFYNIDLNQRLLGASMNYLNEQTKLLYDQTWRYRYYNDLSWVYGITEDEIINYESLYDSTLSEFRKRPRIIEMPLTEEKIKMTLDLFPSLDTREFLLSNLATTMLRGLLAYLFFPYAFYLIYKNIKKTKRFDKYFPAYK